MDEGAQRENRRQRVDYYKWNAVPQYPIKEQNVFHMNAKIIMLCEERDAAIRERDRAMFEKKTALEERDAAIQQRDAAIQQRDAAIAERDNAIRERVNAIAALRFQESNLGGGARRLKRAKQPKQQHVCNVQTVLSMREECNTEAVPISTVPCVAAKPHQVTKRKANKNGPKKSAKSPKKVKKIGEDLNRHITTDGSKAEWELDFGSMNQIQFDESSMKVPVCTCTGEPRQCYKWGRGGWQSSCCTTSLSMYPLPHMPNKRRSRMGGRKMSGSVFSRLLTRMAADGHDLSIPVDLKNYWAKHGTNRYITIK